MYQPFQQQPSGYPPQQQQPQQMSPPAYPAQPYPAQPVQPFQAAQPYQAQPVQPFQAQQAPGPIAPDRESYQSVLPPSVTPGWNDPPAILPTGHGPNRLTAMRRRPVDPSISGSGYGAPQAVQQPQGQPGQYGYGQQPQPQQQQQGYQAYGQQYQQGAPYQQQQY